MTRLLPTKLAIPRPSRPPIHRSRLDELLGGVIQARLTLLSAPPGFGKTTALLDWLARAPVPTAWVTLDETDNDPVRFLLYLRAAIAGLTAEAGASDGVEDERHGGDALANAGLESEIVDPIEAIPELSATLGTTPDPSVIVLDDYHQVTNPGIHRAVGLLLDRLPPTAHVVIATRADPALPLPRLRARGELLEIRADALRFTEDEAPAFFTERVGIDLAKREIDVVLGRTEGWPAVLQLAGLSLAGRPNVSEAIDAFAATHRFVLDFVVEEVLAGVGEETQRFLLETSILERLSGPLCDAVTQGSGGAERLEALDRANLLIVPLDDERRWYRYHQLFADVLRVRLRAIAPDAVAALHARASAWFDEHGDDDAAIAHALQSGDWERTSWIVTMAAGRHLNGGEIVTVRGWLDALPAEVVASHAQLAAAYAWAQLLSGETDGVADRLADAERAMAAGNDPPQILAGIPAQLAMLRSQLAGMRGDTETGLAEARLARELVPAGLPPEGEANLLGTALSLLGLALARAGDPEAGADAYEAAVPHLRASGNSMALGRTIADLAGIEIRRGRPERAVDLCEAELGLATLRADRADERRHAAPTSPATGPAAPTPPATGPAPIPTALSGSPAVWTALAAARAALGQTEQAASAARRAIELAARAGDTAVGRRADEVLRTLTGRPADRPTASPRATDDGLIESLTDRELEVLRLVALGRSNSQVARELFVTVGTVKSHLHSISGKLAAANRVEAVARGRELGLLG